MLFNRFLDFFKTKGKTFAYPLDKPVFTTSFVVAYNSLITLITHELDGDWQFMGKEPITDYAEIAKVISLAEIIKLDNTVLKVADLPKGYQAVRSDRGDDWVISKIEYSDEEIAEMGFVCSNCGELHKDIPMSYVSEVPYDYELIPENEREERCSLSSDQCIIDDERFFIKVQLNIEVDGHEHFSWNPWVEISEPDFERTSELWTDGNRILEPPFPGTVATKIKCYPDTLGLNLMLHTQPVGIKPIAILSESNHPIFLEQKNGINMDRVIDIARQLVYNH